MEAGRRFHDLAAAAGNERSPRVDRCVGDTITSCMDDVMVLKVYNALYLCPS